MCIDIVNILLSYFTIINIIIININFNDNKRNE